MKKILIILFLLISTSLYADMTIKKNKGVITCKNNSQCPYKHSCIHSKGSGKSFCVPVQAVNDPLGKIKCHSDFGCKSGQKCVNYSCVEKYRNLIGKCVTKFGKRNCSHNGRSCKSNFDCR